MTLFYASIFLAVLSSVLYHVFQRATSPAVNPAIGLMVTYSVAFGLAGLLLLVYPMKSSLGDALKQVNWASVALAVSILGLELGFLLAYRAGWDISVAAIAVNAAAGLVLLPAGALLFRERPTTLNFLGVIVCIVGLIMINVRR
jgi:drug/metabolite transporter (DMT)-like permease